MNADRVARKHAYAKSGAVLIAYREVALPLFRIDCEFLVLQTKPIPPIQEFVLRAVQAGLREPADIAGFLGIDQDIALGAAAELLRSEALALAPDHQGSDRLNHLQLTEKGRRAAEHAEQVQAVEIDVPIWVDGLTREVLSVSGRGLSAFRAGEAGDRGLIEISAFPRKRPAIQNVPFETVRDAFAAEGIGRRLQREVVGITGLGKARRFAREGVALAYRAPNETEPIVHLAVDGEISQKHDAAYARSRARSAVPLGAKDWARAVKAVESVVPSNLLAHAETLDASSDLERERFAQEEEADALRAAVADAGPDDRPELEHRLRASMESAERLRVRLEHVPIRQAQVYELSPYLTRAVGEAQERLMIVSSSIRAEVVNDEFVTRLRSRLKQGLAVWIGTGPEGTAEERLGKKGAMDREADRKIRRLVADYPKRLRLAQLSELRAPVLICDSRFAIVAPFDWLAFRGDTHLQIRDERGYYVGGADDVRRVFDSYRAHFDGPDDHAPAG